MTIQAAYIVGQCVLHDVIHEHARRGRLGASNEVEHGGRRIVVTVDGFSVVGAAAVIVVGIAIIAIVIIATAHSIESKYQRCHVGDILRFLAGGIALLGSLVLLVMVNHHHFLTTTTTTTTGIETGSIGKVIQVTIHARGTGVPAKVRKLGGITRIDTQILEDHLALAQRGGYLEELEISYIVGIHVETVA